MDVREKKLVAKFAKILRLPVTTQLDEFACTGEADRSDDRSTNCVEINISNYGISLDEESTGKLWPLLQELPHLEVLKLNHNDLKGGFPQLLPSSLEQLYLHSNEELQGTLPKSFKLRHLSVLWASNCGITGTIPFGIGDLWGIKQVYLCENELSGRIPDTWSTVPLLEVLDLRHNRLTGNLPRSLSQLENLVQLDLSFNQLDGDIPTDTMFGKMKKLQWLNLSRNQFLNPQQAQKKLEYCTARNCQVKVHVVLKKRQVSQEKHAVSPNAPQSKGTRGQTPSTGLNGTKGTEGDENGHSAGNEKHGTVDVSADDDDEDNEEEDDDEEEENEGDDE